MTEPADSASRARTADSAARLFGRRGELRVLCETGRACRRGAGRIVVVTGPAGIGKSRLCSAAGARLAAAGMTVLTGNCLPDAGAEIAYAPFVTAWRDFPEGGFAELLAGLAALGPVPEGIARAWLTDRVVDQVRRWAAARPVALIVEDVQWIDPSSWALLDVLARSAARTALLVVVTAQDHPGDDRWSRLAAMPHARLLPLGPLSGPAVRALARSVGGPAVDAESVLRRGEGHPLFTVELARYDGSDLPPTLRTLLRGRVRRLGADGVRLVAAVALAGDFADLDLCAGLAGGDGFRAAVEHELLVVDRPSGRVRLRHGLFGEAARAELGPAAARALHEQVAAALSLRRSGDAATVTATAAPDAACAPAAVLARLWTGAGRPERARSAWLAAGDEAAGVQAYQEAAHAYRNAIAIRPDTDAVLKAADALRWAGDNEAALAQARAGLTRLAPADADGRVRLLDGVRRYLYAAGRATEAFDALREARAATAQVRSPSVLAAVELAEAGRLLVFDRCEEGATAARRASALLGEGQPDAVRALALSAEGMCLARLGQLDRGLALLRRAQWDAQLHGGARDIARVAANHAYALANASRYGECARICRQALDRLGGFGVADAVGGSLRYNLVTALVALGRWDEAERECASGSASTRIRSLLLACRAGIDAWRGGDRAPQLLAEAEAGIDRDSPVVAAELAYAEAVVGRTTGRYRIVVTRCRAALAKAELIPAPGDRLRLVAGALGALADLQLAGGRVRRFDEPGAVADELLVERDRAIGSWSEPAVPPEAALLARQCAAEAAGPGPRDIAQAWDQLAEDWAELDMPLHSGYARLRFAQALVDSGRVADARPILRLGYDEAGRLGSGWLCREIEQVARRARAPLPGGADGGPQLGTLTRREREVLTLVAHGRTNRDIAQALVISERTAGVHVSRILAKLGAGNRAEAAHLASRATPAPLPAAADGRTKDT